MKLYIMRHGPAEDHSASGRDGDRALTPSGRERVRSVARLLVDEDEAPLLIISSPLVRALQTAEIVAATTKLAERGGRVETRREIEPGADAAGIVRELVMGAPSSSNDEGVSSKKRRVMLVGHEPDLSSLVVALARHPMPAGMSKAMVVGLHVKKREDESRPHISELEELRQRVELRFVLDPKELALERHLPR